MKKELSLQHRNPQVGGLVTGSKQNWPEWIHNLCLFGSVFRVGLQ